MDTLYYILKFGIIFSLDAEKEKCILALKKH